MYCRSHTTIAMFKKERKPEFSQIYLIKASGVFINRWARFGVGKEGGPEVGKVFFICQMRMGRNLSGDGSSLPRGNETRDNMNHRTISKHAAKKKHNRQH